MCSLPSLRGFLCMLGGLKVTLAVGQAAHAGCTGVAAREGTFPRRRLRVNARWTGLRRGWPTADGAFRRQLAGRQQHTHARSGHSRDGGEVRLSRFLLVSPSSSERRRSRVRRANSSSQSRRSQHPVKSRRVEAAAAERDLNSAASLRRPFHSRCCTDARVGGALQSPWRRCRSRGLAPRLRRHLCRAPIRSVSRQSRRSPSCFSRALSLAFVALCRCAHDVRGYGNMF